MADEALIAAMTQALTEAYATFAANGLSTLNVHIGLGDRNGIIRLTIHDVARICARVATERGC